jgi:hypothetical protein
VVVGHMERYNGKTSFIAVHFIHARTMMATINEWILSRMTIISDCGGANKAFEEEGGHTLS